METNGSLQTSGPGVPPAQYFRVVRERKWIILATVILAVGLTALYSLKQTPVYQATAQILRQTAALDQTLFGTSVFQFQDANRELQTGADLVHVDAVGQMVAEDLHSKHSAASLLSMVTVKTSSQTDIISISAESTNPSEAAQVANSFARQFIKYRQTANQSILAAADGKVVAELAQMSAAELASERGITLTQKHEELGILEAMQTGGFELTQEASTPLSAVSPRPVRNAGFALLGGLFLGVLLAFLRDYTDRRIKDEQVLEQEYGLPVLASVPQPGRHWVHRGSAQSTALIGFGDTQSSFLESFRTLRSNLRFFQGDRKTQILLITSGLPEEGKTVTSINLAFSLALSGARVVLLEADLRRPMMHRYLNLEGRMGLSNVLSGVKSFSEVLQVVELPDFIPHPGLNGQARSMKATAQTKLLCVAAGPLPPNPSELLASRRMEEVIGAAAACADYVILDTPPLLLVSDALNLATHADGIIIAVRMRTATKDEAYDVKTMLERSGGRVFGLVANGVSSKQKGYYRGRYKGYYADGSE